MFYCFILAILRTPAQIRLLLKDDPFIQLWQVTARPTMNNSKVTDYKWCFAGVLNHFIANYAYLRAHKSPWIPLWMQIWSSQPLMSVFFVSNATQIRHLLENTFTRLSRPDMSALHVGPVHASQSGWNWESLAVVFVFPKDRCFHVWKLMQ